MLWEHEVAGSIPATPTTTLSVKRPSDSSPWAVLLVRGGNYGGNTSSVEARNTAIQATYTCTSRRLRSVSREDSIATRRWNQVVTFSTAASDPCRA